MSAVFSVYLVKHLGWDKVHPYIAYILCFTEHPACRPMEHMSISMVWSKAD